jgi:hypothetical protein
VTRDDRIAGPAEKGGSRPQAEPASEHGVADSVEALHVEVDRRDADGCNRATVTWLRVGRGFGRRIARCDSDRSGNKRDGDRVAKETARRGHGETLARREGSARGNPFDDPPRRVVCLLDTGGNTDPPVTCPGQVDVGQLGRQVGFDVVDTFEVVRPVLRETLDPPSEPHVVVADMAIEVDTEVHLQVSKHEREQFVVCVVMQWHPVTAERNAQQCAVAVVEMRPLL